MIGLTLSCFNVKNMKHRNMTVFSITAYFTVIHLSQPVSVWGHGKVAHEDSRKLCSQGRVRGWESKFSIYISFWYYKCILPLSVLYIIRADLTRNISYNHICPADTEITQCNIKDGKYDCYRNISKCKLPWLPILLLFS